MFISAKRPYRSLLLAFLSTAGLTGLLAWTETKAAVPTNITFAKAMGTDQSSFKFRNPVWLGEIPGKKGYYAVLEKLSINSSSSMNTGTIVAFHAETNGTWVKQTLHSLSVRGESDETGLLSIAFHPNYTANGRYFIYYTTLINGSGVNILEGRTTDATRLLDNGATADTLLRFNHSANNHHGGGLEFGPDGFLYLAIGENNQGDPAQDLTSLLGKVLRIDVDRQDAGLKYAIPTDNPFYNSSLAGVRKEIWAYGLRNPWRISFDKPTGNLWLVDIGSAGAKRAEEVNLIRKGRNYGWPCREGNQVQLGGTCENAVDPVSQYLNTYGWSCIAGGAVYRGKSTSAFYGHFLFGHFSTGSGRFGVVELSDTTSTGLSWNGSSAPLQISHLFVDSQGKVFVTSHAYSGEIFQLNHPDLLPDTAVTPQPPAPPTGVAVAVGVNQATVTFTASAGATSHTVYYVKGNSLSKTNATKVTGSSPQTLTGLVDSTYTFAVTATNANGESNLSAVVSAKPLSPLALTTVSLPDGRARLAYGPVQLAASGGLQPYAFSLTSGTLPSGLTLSGAGVLSGTPTAADSVGLEFTVTDKDARTAKKSLSLRILPNRPPKMTSSASTKASSGAVYVYNATAMDPDGNALTYSFKALPTWLKAAGARVSGTPNDTDSVATFWAFVSDGALMDSLNVTITISHLNKAPTIDSVQTGKTSIAEGDSTWFRVFAKDPENDSLEIVWGLDSLEPVPGAFRYAYQPGYVSAGAHVITATVTDPDGATATHRFNLTVSNVAFPPQCMNSNRDVLPGDAFGFGWERNRDPDIDSSTVRFKVEAYRDSALDSLVFTKDSLGSQPASDWRKPLVTEEEFWIRVSAWDADGSNTGFGIARKYRFLATVNLRSQQQSAKAKILRKAMVPGRTPGFDHPAGKAAINAAGRRIRR